jgi:general secretion pathway protein E
MGVEPFLVSSSLLGVLAQRLVRLLCPACKQSYQASEADCRELGVAADQPPTLYKANGCKKCNNLGYRGRTGLFELVTTDEHLRTMIHDGAAEQQMEHYARTRSISMHQDGMRRVLAGDTSMEEVLRVTREE